MGSIASSLAEITVPLPNSLRIPTWPKPISGAADVSQGTRMGLRFPGLPESQGQAAGLHSGFLQNVTCLGCRVPYTCIFSASGQAIWERRLDETVRQKGEDGERAGRMARAGDCVLGIWVGAAMGTVPELMGEPWGALRLVCSVLGAREDTGGDS